jgi:Matrixin
VPDAGFDFPTSKIIKELGNHTDQMGLEGEIYPTTKLVWQPRHGIAGNEKGYRPNAGFEGKDYAVWSFEVLGKKYLFEQEFIVSIPRSAKPLPYDCREAWKLPKATIKSGQLELSPLEGTVGIQAASYSATLSALIASAQQTLIGFTDLPATALGQTIGEGSTATITLDQNAAGHGWYVDPTPLDNSDDYLPTSDASVWQAKAGSAAAGKMDMLSVLLHEYGHALGLEHSGNGADFMAASLQPGVRKLPSSEELALMSQLVAQLKAEQGAADAAALSPALSLGERGQEDPLSPFGPGTPLSLLSLLPMGLVRRNAAATNTSTGTSTATHTDYLTAINPTLTNGSFATDSTGQVLQWERVGNVQAALQDAVDMALLNVDKL